jgi:hypothetical protein
MGRNSTIVVAAILVLALAGCSSEGTEQASNSTNPPSSNTASNSISNFADNPKLANTPLANKPGVTQAFSNPVVPGKSPTSLSPATPNLIQSTNATERVIVLSKGRSDPFAQIVGQPIPGMSNANTTAPRPVPVVPPLPTAINGRASIAAFRPQTRIQNVISTNGRPILRQLRQLRPQKNKINQRAIASARIIKRPNSTPKPGFVPVYPRVIPQVVPNPTLVSVLPPPLQPELARSVAVTGVVLIGREPQAIIKVPNEPTSRYVQAGQRLANGVLIKRIEMNDGSNPTVILEQYGMEVARMVGEGVNSTQPGTAATGNPVSVAPIPQNPVPTGAS